MEKTNNPHDKLFKEIWSDPEAAKQFFAKHAPENILKHIDLNTLQIRKDSFVDESLEEFFSDMLYSASFGNNQGYLYLLLEHKSWFDKNTPRQILQYMDKIWEQHAKETKETFPLPIVIPMILYHGEDRWTIGTNFASMFGDKVPGELKPYLPDFKYMLMDLSDFEDKQIMGIYVWNAVLMFFKYVSTAEYEEKIPEILKLVQEELKKDESIKILEALLIYLFSTQSKEMSEIIELIKPNIPKEKEGILMTTADMLRNEGRKEGKQEGKQEGRQEGIEIGEQKGMLTGLYQALKTAILSKFERLPEDIVEKIQTINSEERLLSLTEKAVKCKDLGEYRRFLNSVTA